MWPGSACVRRCSLLALVWPLAESRGEAVTETRDGGAVTAFTYLRWRAVRAFLPGAILMGAAAVLLSYAIVRRLVVGGSPDSTTTDAAFGIAGGVLIIALAVGYWILVARALRPRTLALSPAGIHLSAVAGWCRGPEDHTRAHSRRAPPGLTPGPGLPLELLLAAVSQLRTPCKLSAVD